MDWGALSLDDSPMKPPNWAPNPSTSASASGRYNQGVHAAGMQGRGREGAGDRMGRAAHGGQMHFTQAMANVQGQQHHHMGPGRGAQSHRGHAQYFDQPAMLAAVHGGSQGGVHAYQQQYAAPVEGGVRGPMKGRGREHLVDHSALLAAALRDAATNQGFGAAAPLGGARGMGQGQGRTHEHSTEPMVAVPLHALRGHMGGMHDSAGAMGVSEGQGRGQISAANLYPPQQGTVNVQNQAAPLPFSLAAVHVPEGSGFAENITGEGPGGHTGMERSPRGPEAGGVGFGRGGAGGRGVSSVGGRGGGHVGGRSGKGAVQGGAETMAPLNPRAENMLAAFMDMCALSRLRN